MSTETCSMLESVGHGIVLLESVLYDIPLILVSDKLLDYSSLPSNTIFLGALLLRVHEPEKCDLANKRNVLELETVERPGSATRAHLISTTLTH